ncbi:hypothetical protein [uncultured Vibrio sp.]|uniref:hypothetical protein n=1 Tax=uncultured Vibrio sp. TaxID=114054 RepID=UPI002AA6D45D|nr:hypothetical protein [uncultured Vibrio sp.]
MCCFALIRRLNLWILGVLGIFAFLPTLAAATSASISISGQEGALPLQASGEFSEYTFCDGAKPPNCWTDNSGSLAVRHTFPSGGTYYIGGQSGKGSADWATTLDTGAMAQGGHTFVATACDAKGNCSSTSQSITIDNTPEVTGTESKVEGELDIKGTVDFKEYAGGDEGSVTLYHIYPNNSYAYRIQSKSFEGTSVIDWTYQDIVGSIADGGSWAQGKHIIRAVATAYNGASKSIDIPITIDNTPEVAGSANKTEGDLDIKGTVDFKEYVGGSEGSVTLYHIYPNNSYAYRIQSKSFEGTSVINWTYQDIVGSIADGGSWAQGKHIIRAVATAYNGASTSIDIPITIDNTPEVTGLAEYSEGNLDIKGAVDFKEFAGSNEGSVTLYHIYPNNSYAYRIQSKSFEGTNVINWTYQEIVGSIADGGSWAQGKHIIRVVATAYNGASKAIDIPVTINNTPEIAGSANKTEGDLDIKGTVDFKEYVGGNEGSVTLYHIYPNNSYAYRIQSKSFEGTNVINWTYQEIVGSIADGGSWAQGKHIIRAVATAYNGASTSIDIPITVDNTPEIAGSANNSEGDLDIKGTVNFKEFVGSNEGSVTLYHIYPNNSYAYRIQSESFEGTNVINWTYQEIVGSIADGGSWAQGKHIIRAVATAYNGVSKSIDIPITIDNTPEVAGSTNKTEGDFDIKGTVDFKEYVGGSEGSVTLYHIYPNNSYAYRIQSKSFEGASILNWTYQEIVGAIADGGAWAQGKHIIRAVATAYNGASASIDIPITVDNTPDVTGSANNSEGDLDIKGTVDFKEFVGSNEGSVTLYHIYPNNSYAYRIQSKSFEGTNVINWTYQEIVGSIADGGSWAQGKHIIRAVATAYNGASKSIDIPVTIDNTPKVQIIGPRCYADFTCDILGTVQFKEYVGGNEGSVTLYLKDVSASSYSSYGSKSYEGTGIDWKYADFAGSRISKATWGGKELMVQVVAKAANGATAASWQYLMIPALGCPIPLR